MFSLAFIHFCLPFISFSNDVLLILIQFQFNLYFRNNIPSQLHHQLSHRHRLYNETCLRKTIQDIFIQNSPTHLQHQPIRWQIRQQKCQYHLWWTVYHRHRRWPPPQWNRQPHWITIRNIILDIESVIFCFHNYAPTRRQPHLCDTSQTKILNLLRAK